MVDHPSKYRWTSYRANADSEKNSLISRHSIYLQLGETYSKRQEAYRELFRFKLKQEIIDKIRKATNGNFSLGDERFQNEIAQTLGRLLKPGVQGGQRKKDRKRSKKTWSVPYLLLFVHSITPFD
jgi:putative transposase